jgi:hypothetical protein
MSARRLIEKMATLCVAVATASALTAAQQKSDKLKDDPKRPKMSLRVQPQVAIAPVRVTLTAEVTGGPDDFEEYYCPSIEWEWGDDTSSESKSDCDPYEAGKSQIKRRYTTQHEFRRPGTYKVYFHMKQKDKILGSAAATLQVQPGVGNGF